MICMKNTGGLIMNLFKRIVSSALALSILTTAFSTDVFASEEIIKGQILFEDGSPAVGIKVNILTSTVDEVYDNDVVGFSNNYYTSVYTDSNGNYEFVRPSDYCLVEVDLDSLPSKTGVSSESSFLYPGETVEPFTVYQIANIALNAENSIEVYNQKGDIISTRVDIDSAIDKSSITNILNSDNINTIYTVNANNFLSKTNTIHDLSDYSIVEKADVLFEQGLLSRDDMLSAYLYAIENEKCDDMECFNPVYDALVEYYNGENSKNLSLKSRIANTLALPADRDITKPSVEQMSDFFEAPRMVRAGMFTLHYETKAGLTDTVSSSHISSIISILTDVSNTYFNTYGFKTGKMEDGETTYHIYLDDESISSNGLTTKANNGLFIILKYTNSKYNSQNFARTLAHETFHILQGAYKKNDKSVLSWFKEAGASWAGMEYIDSYCTWGNTYASRYLKSTKDSIVSKTDWVNDRQYGLYLFFKYISQKNGGFSAMKRILEAYTTEDDIYKAFGYCQASGKTSFKALFAGFQAYNADPRYYEYTNGTNSYKCAELLTLNSGKISIAPASAQHYSFSTSSSTSSRIDFTVSMDKENCSNMAVAIAKFSGGNKAKLMRYYPSQTSSYTFSVSGYSSSNINKVTVAICNTGHNTTDAFDFSLSSKVS